MVHQPIFVEGSQTLTPVPVARRGVDMKELELIREGLTENVRSGSGMSARLVGISVAGLSGTMIPKVEKGATHVPNKLATFTAYAPAEAPQYVVAVRLEEAGDKESDEPFFGGPVAGPVAARVLEGLMQLEE